MSDASDALARAIFQNERLAASRLVKKEELGAELEKRRRDRAGLEGMPESPEVTALTTELDDRIARLTTELAAATADLDSARAEIAKLRKLHADHPAAVARATVAAALDEDPVLRSPEMTALDNARAHINERVAQARLGDELGAPASPGPVDAPAPATDAPAPAVKPKKTI